MSMPEITAELEQKISELRAEGIYEIRVGNTELGNILLVESDLLANKLEEINWYNEVGHVVEHISCL